jgi:3-oxoacyl-[acyl-carrier-protein] synthase II
VTARITGMGAVAAVGTGVTEIFEALCAGRTGLAPLRAFDGLRVRHGYEIDDRPGDGRDEPGRATRWLLQAIAEAVAEAGLTDLRDVPVLVGTGLRELRSVELWHRGGPAPGAPHFGAALRDRFGTATSYTFANACSAALYACGLAMDLLATGAADTVVVAGTDALTISMVGLLDRVHPVPPEALRPFDRGRRGVLLGEGAAAVVLTADANPPARARLLGVGLNCDAYHVTAPEPEGIAAAIRDAHARAGIRPEQVDLVLAHGTGTLLNDEVEATALAKVFPGGGPLITAIKSMTGHTSGGSGLLSLAVAAESLRTGRIPPTIGLADPVDEAADLRLVRDRAVTAPVRTAQVDAFGFGGVNAVAILAGAA